MNKKTSGSETITKDHFDRKIGILHSEFGDFKAEMRSEFVGFKDEIRREIKETITSVMDKFYSRIDPLLREVEDAREDREITTAKLTNHERRIKKLENN